LHDQVLALVLDAARSVHHELGQPRLLIARIDDFGGHLVEREALGADLCLELLGKAR